MQTDEITLDQSWMDWLVSQLLGGRPLTELVEVMVRRGFVRERAEHELRAISDSRVMAAAIRSRREAGKLRDLVSAFGTLFSRSGFALEKRHVSPEEFYRDHFFANRPVVVTGLTDDWPAITRWTPSYFRSRFGDVLVEITYDRERDSRYERNFGRHRTRVPFAEYISMVEDGGTSNSYYMVARNHVLDLPELRELSSDFRCPDGFLDPATRQRPYVRLWYGPAGTLTPLHCDDQNILFAQVRGRKHVKLVAPYFYPRLYNEDSCYSQVDLRAIDLERFPGMRGVPVLDIVLEAGECLFIPLGWWHWVKSLDVSISLTFTNFYFNDPPMAWRQVTV